VNKPKDDAELKNIGPGPDSAGASHFPETHPPETMHSGRLLAGLLLAHAAVLIPMRFFGYELSRYWSLLSVTGAAFAGLLVFSAVYIGRAFGKKAVYILCLAFALKVGLGVWHYLFFMDADYFTTMNAFSYFHDFEWMNNKMQAAADFWREEGFSPLPATFYFGNKNPFLLAYNGVLYFLSGNNHLNISPWNALHSIYVAILVGALALQAGATKTQARFALAIAAFQPFGFISNLMWRDSVGQFWLVLGAYLLIATREKKWWWVLTLPAAGFFAWSVRQPYLLLLIALAAYMLASAYRSKMNMWLILLFFGAIAVGLNVLPAVMGLALDRFQGTSQLSFDFFLFPLRIVRAIAGPFPWFQLFMGVDGAEYMPVDFIQAVYNLALIILVVPIAIKKWKETGLDPSFVLSALLFITAAQAVGVHISYVSIGMVLLLPLVCRVPTAKWHKTFFLCLLGFIIANTAYWLLGLAGSGVVQGLTGY